MGRRGGWMRKFGIAVLSVGAAAGLIELTAFFRVRRLRIG